MNERSALAGSLVAGLLASICCIGPLVLGAAGLGSLGLAVKLAPLRPWFLGLTAGLIAVGFYLAYRPERAESCAPGEMCAQPTSRRSQRLLLWFVTVLAVALASYPTWAARRTALTGATASARGASSVVVLDVQGMTCAACEGEIERELTKVPGVVQARASFSQKRAEVRVVPSARSSEALIAAVAKAGYRATVEREQ